MIRATARLPVGTRVGLGVVLRDFIKVKLCINLCSLQAGMAQKFLYGPQIGPAFKEVDGIRVPKNVRADVVLDTRLGCQIGQDIEGPLPGEWPAPIGDKNPWRGPLEKL